MTQRVGADAVATRTCPSCRTSADVSVVELGDDERKGVCDRCLYEWPLVAAGPALEEPLEERP